MRRLAFLALVSACAPAAEEVTLPVQPGTITDPAASDEATGLAADPTLATVRSQLPIQGPAADEPAWNPPDHPVVVAELPPVVAVLETDAQGDHWVVEIDPTTGAENAAYSVPDFQGWGASQLAWAWTGKYLVGDGGMFWWVQPGAITPPAGIPSGYNWGVSLPPEDSCGEDDADDPWVGDEYDLEELDEEGDRRAFMTSGGISCWMHLTHLSTGLVWAIDVYGAKVDEVAPTGTSVLVVDRSIPWPAGAYPTYIGRDLDDFVWMNSGTSLYRADSLAGTPVFTTVPGAGTWTESWAIQGISPASEDSVFVLGTDDLGDRIDEVYADGTSRLVARAGANLWTAITARN
jgi:hypothetical protein